MACSLNKREAFVYLYLSLKVSDWSGHGSVLTQGLRPYQTKLGMSPSSTVNGSQYDTEHVTIELLYCAAVVADDFWFGATRLTQLVVVKQFVTDIACTRTWINKHISLAATAKYIGPYQYAPIA